MTRDRLMAWLGGAVVLGAVLGAGCANTPPTQFYVLSALTNPAETASAGNSQGVAVGLGPVELPDHLDRPQIVTRTSLNELTLSEFDRWAEPLRDNVSEVLAENLATLLASRRVAVHPWRRGTPVAYQVIVKVIRFDRTVNGDAVLKARWSILGGDGGQELRSGEVTFSERPAGPGYPETVTAMNQTLTAFSRDLAETIRALDGATGKRRG